MTLTKKIADLATLSLRLGREISALNVVLQSHVEGTMTVPQFVALPEVPDIDTHSARGQRDLAAVLKLEELSKRPRPVAPPALTFDGAAFLRFLRSDLQGVSISAMEQVRAHVASVLDKERGQRWLRYGLAVVPTDVVVS